MPNQLSVLGIVHTAFSVVALLVAFYALLRYGKINPAKSIGKFYTILTVITCLTSLPIMKTGHLTGAHGLAVMVLIMLPLAAYVKSIPLLGNKAGYVQTMLMSATVFLSMIPAIVETLTRVPLSAPIASSPEDPTIKSCLIVLMIAFIGGVTYQVRKIYADDNVAVSG